MPSAPAEDETPTRSSIYLLRNATAKLCNYINPLFIAHTNDIHRRKYQLLYGSYAQSRPIILKECFNAIKNGDIQTLELFINMIPEDIKVNELSNFTYIWSSNELICSNEEISNYVRSGRIEFGAYEFIDLLTYALLFINDQNEMRRHIIYFLIGHGIDLLVMVNSHYHNRIEYFISQYSNFNISEEFIFTIIQLYSDHGYDINTPSDAVMYGRESLLLYAFTKSHNFTIIQYIINIGADITPDFACDFSLFSCRHYNPRYFIDFINIIIQMQHVNMNQILGNILNYSIYNIQSNDDDFGFNFIETNNLLYSETIIYILDRVNIDINTLQHKNNINQMSHLIINNQHQLVRYLFSKGGLIDRFNYNNISDEMKAILKECKYLYILYMVEHHGIGTYLDGNELFELI